MREGTGVADAVEQTDGAEWLAATGKSRARVEGRSVRKELSSVDEVDEEGHITRPSKSPAVIRILDASMSLRAAMKTWLSEDAMGLEAKESFMHLVYFWSVRYSHI